MTEQQRDAITAARGMTAELAGMNKRLDDTKAEWAERDKALTAYGHRNRLLAWLAGVVAAIAIGLGIAVAILYVRVSDNAATLADLHTTQVAACQAGNTTRAEEIQLWNHIASAAITSKTPPARRAADERLLAYIRHTFAPRNCAQVYRLRS